VDAQLAIHMLDTQYRMHPGISHFPSKHFYDSKLKDGVTAEQRIAPLGFCFPNKNIPIAFIQMKGKEEDSNSSKYNRDEALMLLKVMRYFLQV
jgi:superfamily I DNA and/or RNA helicase